MNTKNTSTTRLPNHKQKICTLQDKYKQVNSNQKKNNLKDRFWAIF